ncbi:MAG: hypothetical protein O9301_05860 [Leptospira sp.]|nr:hypothetical protein [Leptospira sp.]
MSNILKLTLIFILTSALYSIFPAHTVLLKQGKTIRGIITNQNLDHVEIDTQDGKHLVLPKKSVLKVIYRDLAEADEEKIRKEEEEKRQKDKEKILTAKREEILKKKNEIEEAETISRTNAKLATLQTESSIRNSFILGSIDRQSPITLAMLDAKCTPYSEFKEYYYLFGAFRWKEPDWNDLLPKDTRPIRIKQSSSYTDLAITILGGFLISITRKTIYVDVCEGSGYRLLSDESINRLKEEAVQEVKVEQELREVEEKYEMELLEKDLEKIQKRK